MTKLFLNSKAKRAAETVALISIIALSGCGGGGKSGPSVAVADPKPLPAPAKAAKVAVGANGPSASGIDLSGLYFTIPDTSKVKVSDRSALGGNGASLSPLDPNDNATLKVGGLLAGGTAPPANKQLEFMRADNTGIAFEDTTSTDGSDTSLELLTFVAPGNTLALLDNSGYGLYSHSDGKGKEQTGFVFGGDATAKAQVPVTANYSGSFVGIGFANDGSAGDGKSGYARGLDGDVALSLNATQGTVKGNVYNMQQTDTNDVTTSASYGLAIDAKIDATTGNTYQGAVNFTKASSAPGAAAVAGATQSNVIGGLYGPGAAETTGALQVQGKAPGIAPEIFVSGAYGAVKK